MKHEVTIRWYDRGYNTVTNTEKIIVNSLEELRKLVGPKWWHGADVSIYIPSQNKYRSYEYYVPSSKWEEQTEYARTHGNTFEDYCKTQDRIAKIMARISQKSK